MLGRSNVIKLVLCGILCFGIGLVVLNITSTYRQPSDAVSTKQNQRQSAIVTTKQANPFKPVQPIEKQTKIVRKTQIAINADYKSANKPEQLSNANNKTDLSKISIQRSKILLKNKKNKTILVRECGAGTYDILLLHGQRSSSKVWVDIGTLQYLCAWGYHAFAIDLPSTSKNNSLPVEDDKEAVQWLNDLIRKLHLKNLVLISPSMSGRLTLPYVLHLDDQQTLIRGFVPIAPVGTNKYKSDDFKKIKIPTLIVHGENDKRFQSAFESLKQIPKNEVLLMKDTGHVSYVEKPIEFHNALRQFLYNIYRPIYENDPKLPNKQT